MVISPGEEVTADNFTIQSCPTGESAGRKDVLTSIDMGKLVESVALAVLSPESALADQACS